MEIRHFRIKMLLVQTSNMRTTQIEMEICKANIIMIALLTHLVGHMMERMSSLILKVQNNLIL
jgi:hypothetical protein